MKIIIVEDELPAQRMLRNFIVEINPDSEIEAIFGSVGETVAWLKSHTHPDLIFLDVQLSDGFCFSILEQINIDSFVIFTTAYDQYAIDAFKANTIDYLLKPIRKEQLEAAINKLDDRKRLFQKAAIKDLDLKNLLSGIVNTTPNYRTRFLISKADSWYKLEIKDIAFFYIDNKMTLAIDFDNKRHPIDMPLDQIIESLNPKQFFRTNRQSIVNIDAIQKVENWFGGKLLVKTKPECVEKIIVSKEKVKLFRDIWLNQ